ncbi:MAG: hypothetical protein WCF84_16790 [Anaerolineae bacterium]
MKRTVLLLLVAVVLCACNSLPGVSLPSVNNNTPVPTPSPTDSWKSFTHTAGRFSASVPTEFKETTQSTSTLLGKIDMHIFTAVDDAGAAMYAIGYADFPAAALKNADQQALLKGTVEGAAKNIGGKVTSQVAGVQNEMQAREFNADIPAGSTLPGGGVMRGRVFIVQNRLYQVYAITTKELAKSPLVDKFLNSFKFTAPK